MNNLLSASTMHYSKRLQLVKTPTSFTCAGNCWFVAAVSLLASDDALFKQVIPEGQDFSDGSYAGIQYAYTFLASNIQSYLLLIIFF